MPANVPKASVARAARSRVTAGAKRPRDDQKESKEEKRGGRDAKLGSKFQIVIVRVVDGIIEFV